MTKQEIFSRIEHKKIRCERVSQKLRVCGEDLGLNWSHPCDATELVGGSQDLVPVLEEFHQKILAALSSQKTMTEVVTPTLCRKLMVGELASLFRKHGLKVSDSEPSHFCTCVDHVLALAGDAVLNPRDFLRSTVTEALQDFPSLENSRLKS